MKPFIFSLLLSFTIAAAQAQVTGKTISTENQPLPFVNISLLSQQDTSLIKSLFTDTTGAFTIRDINPGTYFIRASMVGYQTWTSPVIKLINQEELKDFGSISLVQEEKQLGEVIIRADKPLYQQKPEGTIINVENSMMAKGSSVLEILERTPGIYIDYRNNKITMNGKSGVSIMVNGKQQRLSLSQLLALLGSMSANDVEKIELLTTPPSNYDAEGTAGLINIVSKKSKRKGTNAQLSLTAGYAQGEKGTASVNLGHNNATTNIFGSYSYTHEKNPTDFTGVGLEVVPILGGDLSFDFANKTKPIRKSHNASIAIDKSINPKLTIGGNVNMNVGKSKSAINNRTIYNALPDSIMTFAGTIDGKAQWKNIVSSIYAEKKLKEGEKVMLDIDYLLYNTNSPTIVESTFKDKHGNAIGDGNEDQFAFDQRGFSETTIKVMVLKADYSKEINKKLKLDIGIKGTTTRSSSSSGIESLIGGSWINRNGTVNDIDMNEKIAAAYTSLSAEVKPTLKIVAGLRYEYLDMYTGNRKTDSNSVSRKMGNLFPSLFITRKLTDNSDLIFSYTKRISRPTYNDLTSYIAYNDPLSVFTGNPFLKPAITHNVKVGYNYKSFTFSLLASRDNNPILKGQLVPSPARNLVYISPQNATYQNNLTLETIIPVKVNNWWNMNYGFTGGWRQFRIDYLPSVFKKSFFGYSVNFNQSLKFKNNFSAELSGWYNGNQYGGTSKTFGFGALNTGIKKELKNGKGTFLLTATDFLSTLTIRTHIGHKVKDAFATDALITYNVESARFPLIKLTYTRSFGTAVKNMRKQNSGEERERIRNN